MDADSKVKCTPNLELSPQRGLLLGISHDINGIDKFSNSTGVSSESLLRITHRF
jgi:hypothetical protein